MTDRYPGSIFTAILMLQKNKIRSMVIEKKHKKKKKGAADGCETNIHPPSVCRMIDRLE